MMDGQVVRRIRDQLSCHQHPIYVVLSSSVSTFSRQTDAKVPLVLHKSRSKYLEMCNNYQRLSQICRTRLPAKIRWAAKCFEK